MLSGRLDDLYFELLEERLADLEDDLDVLEQQLHIILCQELGELNPERHQVEADEDTEIADVISLCRDNLVGNTISVAQLTITVCFITWN